MKLAMTVTREGDGHPTVKLPDPAVQVHGTFLFDVELRAVFEPPLAPTLLALKRRCKTATMRPSQPFGGHDGNFSVASGLARRRRGTDCNRAAGECPISLATGAGRRRTCSLPWRAEVGARSGAHARVVRGAGAARCRLRHIGARPSRELDSDHVPGHRRGRHHHVRSRMDSACAGAGHAVGSCDCTRRDRRAAGRRGSQRDLETTASAASPARDTSGRESAERCERAADLSHRRARGCIGRAEFRDGPADVVAVHRRQCVRRISARAPVHAARDGR